MLELSRKPIVATFLWLDRAHRVVIGRPTEDYKSGVVFEARFPDAVGAWAWIPCWRLRNREGESNSVLHAGGEPMVLGLVARYLAVRSGYAADPIDLGDINTALRELGQLGQ